MESPLLQVKNLTKTYGKGLLSQTQTVALEDFSLQISGDNPVITTIAGESGSGKTTLANLILGFLSPTSGEILYDGQDIWQASKREWIKYRREVQGIFQDPYGTYNPFYKVDYVFDMVIEKFKLASSRAEARQVTEEALEVVGLRPNEILGKYPHQLSGGQRQRIMVARAFLLKPRLIIADEPVSMIDASLQVRILDILLRLKQDFGISFLYITHDLSTAYQISDDIFILYLGSVMERGDIDAVMQEPQHPYSQLLLRSIPVPDPNETWEERLELPPEEQVATIDIPGCKYYQRCPYAMDICNEAPPPLYHVGPRQWAACYLRKDMALEP
jgi:oligopeptide/dipeptide ABC transporter ATP-binding protein